MQAMCGNYRNTWSLLGIKEMFIEELMLIMSSQELGGLNWVKGKQELSKYGTECVRILRQEE